MQYYLKNVKDVLTAVCSEEKGLTQAELAERSGISLGSLRRFETTGEISLRAFLELALILGELKEFSSLFRPLQTHSLFEEAPHPRQRSSRKSQLKEQA